MPPNLQCCHFDNHAEHLQLVSHKKLDLSWNCIELYWLFSHYSEPDIVDFPNTSDFKGEVKHSHSYRTPEPFLDKSVLVCGGGPSGIDISYDLAKFASKVI